MRIISVLSTKGGVGKTTIASNLSLALSDFGRKVALIDFNFTTPHISLYFNLLEGKTLNNFLKGECQFSETFHLYNNLTIIPSSVFTKDIVPIEIDLKNVLEENLKDYEFVILDSAPGLGKEAMISLNVSQEIIFVCEPNLISVFDVVKTNKLIKEMQNKIVWGIILNKVKGKSYELSKEEVEKYSRLPVLATIREDYKFVESINERKPAYYLSENIKESFKALAAKIAGIPYERKKSFLSFFERFFKRREI